MATAHSPNASPGRPRRPSSSSRRTHRRCSASRSTGSSCGTSAARPGGHALRLLHPVPLHAPGPRPRGRSGRHPAHDRRASARAGRICVRRCDRRRPLPRTDHYRAAGQSSAATGLIVNPTVAQKQIAEEQAAQAGRPGSTHPRTASERPVRRRRGRVSRSQFRRGRHTGGNSARRRRFHATKALDPTRPVRDISLITDEIITPLFTANGVHVTITVDIESAGLAKLTPDQVWLLRRTWQTLGSRTGTSSR